MTQTISKGITIAYDDIGKEEPVLLFLPGWCANKTVFQDLLPLTSWYCRSLALDWRGHGDSDPVDEDFGIKELMEDALQVIKASGAKQVIPVALAHSGWVALELRKYLGTMIPKIILIEWLIFEAPPPFLQALQGMQNREQWKSTVDKIFSMWLQDVDNPKLIKFVKDGMGIHGFDMWSRAAREITKSYKNSLSPLQAFSALSPNISVLHIYGQPDNPNYLAEQQSFAKDNPWFHVHKLEAKSHFPMFEVPEQMVDVIKNFVFQGY